MNKEAFKKELEYADRRMSEAKRWFNNGAHNGLYYEIRSEHGDVLETATEAGATALVNYLNMIEAEISALRARIEQSPKVWLCWRKAYSDKQHEWIAYAVTAAGNMVPMFNGQRPDDRIEKVYAVPVEEKDMATIQKELKERDWL